MSGPVKPVGVALSGQQLAALLGDRGLVARLDAGPLAFAVTGIDRIDGATTPAGPTVESTIAAATLAALAPRLGWLAAAAVHRDHPYNLARRVASLDHVSDGRAGLLLGLSDGYAPSGREGHEVWGGAGLTEGVPIGIDTTADAAAAIQALWHSWPAAAIVADRDTGVYARSEEIVHVDHRGVFDIDGPLTVPTTAQGAPVLAWRATTLPEAARARRVAEVLLWPLDAARTLDDVAAAPGTAALFAEVAASDPELDARVAALLADDRVVGVVLRPDPSPDALAALLADGAGGWRSAAAAAVPGSGTLRERLGLPSPAPRPAGGRPAFPPSPPER